jgi:hypothetical protein
MNANASSDAWSWKHMAVWYLHCEHKENSAKRNVNFSKTLPLLSTFQWRDTGLRCEELSMMKN